MRIKITQMEDWSYEVLFAKFYGKPSNDYHPNNNNNNKKSDDCPRRRMCLPSRNRYKCKQVACSVVVACLLVYPLFLYCTLLLSVYIFLF